MNLRKLGQTNIDLFPIGLGAMPLSTSRRPPREKAIAVIEKAIQCNVNFIDTANVYCVDNADIGHNEALIAEALATLKPKNKIYVATKGGLTRPDGRWERKADPEFLRKSCEESLKALNTNQIFLYQLHAPDPKVRFEDTLQCLAQVQQEGKVLHLGLSNVSVKEAELAQTFFKVQSIQNLAHPLHAGDYASRDASTQTWAQTSGVLEFCIQNKITYLPYSPVGGGHQHGSVAKNATIQKIAKHHQRSPYEVILAWHLAQSDQVVPIPGASRCESIESSAASVTLELSKEEIGLINQVAF